MTDETDVTGDRSEDARRIAGVAPEKWAVMNREERRAAVRATRQAPHDRQIRRPGRDR